MTDRRSYDGLSMGSSCTLYYYTVISFLCYVAFSGINYFSLHVQMAPRQNLDYSGGCSKSVAPLNRLIIGLDDERDLEYVPPGTRTPLPPARSTRATPTRVAPGVVTTSQYQE